MDADSEGGPQPGRKRVRFDDSVTVADKPATSVPATVLSNIDDEDDELTAELQAGGRSLQGAEASLDGEGGEELSQSELAAALRAQHRKELDSAGEGSILDDVAAAEAAYDEPDELITEDGIPIEPFNLRREREEGYFDADGNYIEYALKDDDDAWLASLAETVMGDILPELPAAGGAAAQAAAVAEEDGQSEEQMRAWRARLVDLLAPGETVLDALRRMAVRSSPDQAPAAAEVDAPVAMAVDSSARKDKGVARPRLSVPAAHREVFNELTECSTLLLDNGDYNAHSHTREQLQQDLDQQQRLQQQQQEEDARDVDIFADEDDMVQPSKASKTSHDPALGPSAAAEQGSSQAPAFAQSVINGNQMDMEAQPLAARPADTAARPAAPSSPLQASNSALEKAAAGRNLAEGSAQEGVGRKSDSLQFDKRTGMYYDAELGCYWDGGQLYGDSASGQWYRFQDGQYQLVS